MSTHATRVVEVNGHSANIDLGIADLIEQLWLADFDTFNSCEDNFGLIWIEILGADAEHFLSLAAGDDRDDNLYTRICDGGGNWSFGDLTSSGRQLGRWHYSTALFDVNHHMDWDDESGEQVADIVLGPTNFAITLSVRFPKDDYPIVLERMKAHNASAVAG